MKQVTVGMHEAKTTLSQLVKKVRAGEIVIIANHGEPVAKLIAYSGPASERTPGRLAGRIVIKPGFDELPAGFEAFTD